MTPTRHVTTTLVNTIDADPDQAREVLTRIDPVRTLAGRLSALGLEDRAVWCRTSEVAHRLVWRFGEDAGFARIDWELGVEPDGAGASKLTLTISGRGSDSAARARLLDSWLLVEELARAQFRRLARTLEDYMEEDADAAPATRRLHAVGS